MDLTPLINDMYPSRQAIDNFNKEIIAEAKFEKEQLKKMGHLKESKPQIQDLKSMILEGVKAQADANTSNEQSTLIIYNRANQGLVFDVPGSNFRSGQELRLWDRRTNHNRAQHFSTFENDATIRIGALCLERDKDSYVPGAKIHLHFCNGHNAQK